MLINETDFGVFSVKGAENPKIDFLKARLRRAFKKSVLNNENCWQTRLKKFFELSKQQLQTV